MQMTLKTQDAPVDFRVSDDRCFALLTVLYPVGGPDDNYANIFQPPTILTEDNQYSVYTDSSLPSYTLLLFLKFVPSRRPHLT